MKFDETINGGRFQVGGQLVNANGEFIDADGNLIGGRLPKKPLIKIRLIRDFYQVGGIEETKKLENGIILKTMQEIAVRKDWITEKSITAKANEIFNKVKKKYQRRIKNASENEIETIIEAMDAEYYERLNRWIYPEKIVTGGRTKGSTKISAENFKELAPQIYHDQFYRTGNHLNLVDLAAELDISRSTLIRYLQESGWRMKEVRAEAMKKKLIFETF